ncbi:hypothetical protein [Streptomyces sp. NPDC060031]|uniref:hypothetical protein n=1 Tax=Streptomyces sp. NPDC060031 TaxID=3347043 RepID=UPI0036C69CCC
MSHKRIGALAIGAALIAGLSLTGPVHATATGGPVKGSEAEAAALAGVSVPAPTGEAGPSGLRHVTTKPMELPAGVADKLLASGAAVNASYTASFSPSGWTSTVRMNIFTGSDGHDYAWGEAWLQGGGEALYLDVSRNGGATWTPFVDYQVPSGVYTRTSYSHYDGPGYWIRACGANPSYGDPYNNPQWGYNIACTVWH